MYSTVKAVRSGLSLIELLITMVVSSVLVLAVGVLLVGGQRSWQRTYDQANSKMQQDSQAVMYAWGSVGRKSNRRGYTVYNKSDSSYSVSPPLTSNPEEVVYGDAVEFHYWSAAAPDANLLDVTNTGTDYAFFYIDGDELKVDYGTCPPGAVPGGSGSRNTSGITTTVLARNVVPHPSGAFSHTMVGGVGQGCVRINIVLEDEEDSREELQILTATLARNIWPR